jgi:hypothetical protein
MENVSKIKIRSKKTIISLMGCVYGSTDPQHCGTMMPEILLMCLLFSGVLFETYFLILV